ncbi:sugar phosphate isomerase/epimerase family protein [Alloacidobacterium sp.]|uniref:sugar phosphate isomerase/epimerase family protein n=1 Tax=Alloacidobacterium sp. TaxID=2951999 RepID=UPI002D3D97A3|nr:sugar phosphate isomerase/epimerase family protein [Alloacidobacterium sp.]HYK37526.1 sugar phosphate isomerase/epimerase family protein [Alloacidobacterium sp.]
MLKVISTHVFLRSRLHPGLLDVFARAGAQGVELFAARQHFDYTSRAHVREIAEWFQANAVEAFSMHAPMFPDLEMGRGGAPAVNVIHPEKSRRIDAMDEIKRALEVAEQVPIRYLILHLGEREDGWSPRSLENSLTALEHLRAFANPLGVKLLVENIQNEVTQPRNLVEILNVGHFKDIGVCLDTGHAHLGDGVATTIAELRPLIRSSHLHDNKGGRDEHLWPGDGTIAWEETIGELKSAPQTPAGVLEIHYTLEETPESVTNKAQAAFEKFGL